MGWLSSGNLKEEKVVTTSITVYHLERPAVALVSMKWLLSANASAPEGDSLVRL